MRERIFSRIEKESLERIKSWWSKEGKISSKRKNYCSSDQNQRKESIRATMIRA